MLHMGARRPFEATHQWQGLCRVGEENFPGRRTELGMDDLLETGAVMLLARTAQLGHRRRQSSHVSVVLLTMRHQRSIKCINETHSLAEPCSENFDRSDSGLTSGKFFSSAEASQPCVLSSDSDDTVKVVAEPVLS